MGLFKRTCASLGLVALLCVSGVALADDDVNDTLDDTLVQTIGDAGTDGSGDGAGDEGQSDSDTADDLAPNGAPICPTLRDAESIDVEGTLVDYVAVGTESFEFHTGIVDANDVDEDALMATFSAEGIVDSERFIEFLEPFNDPNVDLSKIQGIQEVTVIHTWGGTCTGEDWHGSVALAVSQYKFEVVFPTTSAPTYAMPLFFDDQELSGVAVVLTAGADPRFDRLVELNDKEMSIGDFLTVLENDLGVSSAELEVFPKVGEVYGKHTVKFADFDNTYSSVTVVYPEKDSGAQPTQNPQTPITPQPPKPSTGNSTSSNNVVTPSSMSYIQFRGNSAPVISPVGSSPIVTAPAPVTGGDATTGNNAEGDSKQGVSAPKLPVTSDDRAEGALVADDSSSASQAALFGLVACVVFGVVAAASVITVRRAMKAKS